MAAVIQPRVCTSQPMGLASIDWANPITRGLTSAYIPGQGEIGFNSPVSKSNVPNLPSLRGVASSFSGGVSSEYIRYSTPGSLYGASRKDGSIVAFMRYTDTTLRGSQLFGHNGSAAVADRVLLQHWTDGKMYFDWGGATTGSGRVSASVSKTLNPFLVACVAGSTVGKKLFVDGTKIASNPSDFTAFPSTSAQFSIGNLYMLWTSDACEIYVIFTFNRDLLDAEIRSLSANPWQIFRAE